jgi:hypothetical protein
VLNATNNIIVLKIRNNVPSDGGKMLIYATLEINVFCKATEKRNYL